MRECGDCTLCCKLLPVVPLGKGANERCQHQRRTGCRVYDTRAMPRECMVWNCRWLVNESGDTSRPDRLHMVIDVMPDFITARDNETGVMHQVEVVQVWCDPKHPTAHRDPAFRRYVVAQAALGKMTLVRFNTKDAVTLLTDSDGNVHEMGGESLGRQHDFREIVEAISHG